MAACATNTLTTMLASHLLACRWISESQHITVSSGAFDPAVTAHCAADASPSSEATVCEARFQWVVTEHVEDRLRARLDVGGQGVPAGWLVDLDFGAGTTVHATSLVAAELLSADGPRLQVRPRLASGYGTVEFDLRVTQPPSTQLQPYEQQLARPAQIVPRIACVPAPPAPQQPDGAWCDEACQAPALAEFQASVRNASGEIARANAALGANISVGALIYDCETVEWAHPGDNYRSEADLPRFLQVATRAAELTYNTTRAAFPGVMRTNIFGFGLRRSDDVRNVRADRP